jgi:hypothetical protein
MEQAFRRTAVRGPTFIRLLARLTDADAQPSNQPLSNKLGQWLNWTHAVALSTALDGKLPTAGSDARPLGGDEVGECARMRASLARAIASAPELADTRQRRPERLLTGEACAHLQADYAVFHQCYLNLQRKMLAATGHLRGMLREMLTRKGGDMARLAAVDAAMELALSPREQKLLASVPALLGEHFERLHRAEQTASADKGPAPDASAAASGAWLETFRRDMRNVLFAELDVRFQPIEGLLAALRLDN